MGAEVEIGRRIKARGQITFAEFMELALYAPGVGYYGEPSVIGAQGDFYTSPLAHPVFGALMAVQLCCMWDAIGRPNPFHAIELGSGNGTLGRDLTSFASQLHPKFYEALRYVGVDRHPAKSTNLRTTEWNQVISKSVPFGGIVGCFLSNELVDSFPVHRFQVRNGEIMEIYVTANKDGTLAEVIGPPSSELLRKYLRRSVSNLPEGYKGVINLEIIPWIREISAALSRGFVLTIDYGYEEHDYYSPDKLGLRLQTYFRHTEGSDPLTRIGRQDITAHVNFSLLQCEGRKEDLHPLGLTSQADWLRSLGFESVLSGFRTGTYNHMDKEANIMGILQLVNQHGLGNFKVLMQQKNTGLDMLDNNSLSRSFLNHARIPTLDSTHMPLLAGSYPHTQWNMENLFDLGESR